VEVRGGLFPPLTTTTTTTTTGKTMTINSKIGTIGSPEQARQLARYNSIIECLYLSAGSHTPTKKRFQLKSIFLNEYDNFVASDLTDGGKFKTPKWSRMSEVSIDGRYLI
tara:strand:+ start:613 stop:942 length:330 start_codon:yes stop_codon:yes gene_type:complete